MVEVRCHGQIELSDEDHTLHIHRQLGLIRPTSAVHDLSGIACPLTTSVRERNMLFLFWGRVSGVCHGCLGDMQPPKKRLLKCKKVVGSLFRHFWHFWPFRFCWSGAKYHRVLFRVPKPPKCQKCRSVAACPFSDKKELSFIVVYLCLSECQKGGYAHTEKTTCHTLLPRYVCLGDFFRQNLLSVF